MKFTKWRIRFGLKSIMFLTLIVAVTLGLAVAKLRRQTEQRAALGEMLGQNIRVTFAKNRSARAKLTDYFETRFMPEDILATREALEDKGWRHSLFTPDLFPTIDGFDAGYWRPVEDDPRIATWASQMPHLKAFNASQWQSLTALSQLTELETLIIGRLSIAQGGMHGIAGGTSSKTQLANFKAIPRPPIDLTPLADLTKLQHLCLGGFGKTSLKPLAGMTQLETLELPFSGDTDLSPLSKMTRLHLLDLIGSPAEDFTPIGSLTKLTSLDLTESNASDIRALANLKNLTTLKMSGTHIDDLSPLAGLQKLEHLTFADTRITDISALRGKVLLKKLFLSHTKVEDVSALANCSALTIVDLSHTKVSDISPLANCESLETLDISGCPVTDLGPLSGCKFRIVLTLTQKVDIPQDLRRHIWRMDD